MYSTDTIIAVSTASGFASRGIVRLSGPQAIELVQSAACDAPQLAEQPPYTRLAVILALQDATQVPVDLYLMRAPYSYTREHIVEIHTFGSPVLLEMITENFLARGARLAEAGEFTQRAFLNGRIDLTQAEAVLQIIRSRTDSELRLALRQLNGRFSREIAATRDKLIEICALAEIAIDFTDQDVEIISNDDLSASICQARELIAALAEQSQRQSGGKPGVSTVLCGRPNVGKSSLLNALTGRSRSIVTALAGTTRDVVEDLVTIDDCLFRLSDTAGTRETEDIVEREAVVRARQIADAADLVLLVIDLQAGLDQQELKFWQNLQNAARVAVLNKADLAAPEEVEEISQMLADAAGGTAATVVTSCTAAPGIDDLKRTMVEVVRSGRIDASAPSFLLNARHCDAVRRAVEALGRAQEAADEGLSTEFAALDLRVALDALGEITGEVCTDDILGRIFSDFCIGK